ncbi:MAG TPA: glycoside hydrolase family 3 N-terminal domain-containing protein [Anaerolineae bacterium]|jgi:beta-glucosidase
MTSFRDLNKNGRLDPYEDSSQPIKVRVEDLLSQMTLEEKAGQMFQTFTGVQADDETLEKASGFSPFGPAHMVRDLKMTHLNLARIPAPRLMAQWHNWLQRLAENERLGIPMTLSTDPRHAFTTNAAVGSTTSGFSQWPEPIGLAATRDAALVQQFGDIARQEYLAVGIRAALHPMADLATEPRWARINGTFGEDAALAAELTFAYIRGFQGETLGPHSVACMTKHFPGGGPQKDGMDPHFEDGKEQVYPGNNFDYHLVPFEAAFQAGTAMIMPYYGQPIGLKYEPVGFGFNKDVITGLLRQRYGFDGVVCTDWGLLTDVNVPGNPVWPARAWGVEHLSRADRMLKALDAGIDQFGGEICVDELIGLVRSGRVSEARIDESVRRLLRDKFRLGLFDNPYVDVDIAEQIAGRLDFRAAGALAQRKSIVLLKNSRQGDAMRLPLSAELKLYVEGVDKATAGTYGQVVDDIAQADCALLRISTPFVKQKGFLRDMIHQGDLDFKGEEKVRLLGILARVPTVVCINLDRPAVIPEIAEHSAALLAEFGASDAAVLDVVYGRFKPTGKLPFELPSSMEAVRQQLPDVPYDSANPLYAFGYGLTF